MRRHRRGRITVQSQPTGVARGMTRLMGVIHAVFGFVFVVISLTEIMPVSGLFGLPFLLIGGFFCINGIRIAVSKNGLAHRVGYDVETGIEEETIVGLLEDVDREAESRPQESHQGTAGTAGVPEVRGFDHPRGISEKTGGDPAGSVTEGKETPMKLANALSQRAELQTRIHQLETRLYNNAQVQEGESPAEDPQDLLQELEEDYARLEALIACINRTNCCTLVDGVPLSDLLARRDCRKGKLGILRNFLDNASELVSRRTVGEIRIRSTVDVRSMQREVDRMSKELRELDEKIQEANWTTDLLFLEEK